MTKFAEENYKKWLESENVSKEDKEILKNMTEAEKDDAFFKDIEFGTGGLRGVIGPGTNRINVQIVSKITCGFGLYLIRKYPDAKERGVVISHDNRHMSREFTLTIVDILNRLGINTYIFDSLRPTPELSFAVRRLHTIAGIMITASHNPKEYNGYKAYDETGCQYVPEVMEEIIKVVDSLGDLLNVKVPEADVKGKNVILGKEIDDEYITLVKGAQVNPNLSKKGFRIVYTPNHGASFMPVMRVLKELGYDVVNVPESSMPNPDFVGVKSPNPEDAVAYEGPIALAKKVNADVVLMTDPDGDRLGVASRGKDGEYTLLTGNETAALLLDYILKNKKERGELDDKSVMITTVVTSGLGKEICERYGVKTLEVLTGFKYIGEKIHEFEEQKDGLRYVFGYEESYGCLYLPFVRDKDATQAVLLYAELALYYKSLGMDLAEAYKKLCEPYGFHKAKVFSVFFKGSDGNAKMNALLSEVMANPFTELYGKKVKIVENYRVLVRKHLDSGLEEKIVGIPTTDLIKFIFEDNSTLAMRPSGTEPKCKFYIEIVENDVENVMTRINEFFECFKKHYNF